MSMEWKFALLDPEERLGLSAAKLTGVGNVASLTLGVVLCALFYGLLTLVRLRWPTPAVEMFFHGGAAQRSMIPYWTMLLAMWSLAILLFKRRKLKVQRAIFALELPGGSPAERLSALKEAVDAPEEFLATRRLQYDLQLQIDGIGRAERAEMLEIAAGNDEKYLESTFTQLRGFIWAIPVLGFIGTVVGLARAVGGFGLVLTGEGGQLSDMRGALSGVTGGLAVAFETTLIALAAALVLQLLLTMQLKAEEDLLDAVPDFLNRFQ